MSETPSNQSPEFEEERQNDAVINRALVGSLVVFLCLGGVGFAIWFATRPAEEKPPENPDHVSPKPRNNQQAEIPLVRFTDVTPTTGITFQHENGGTDEKLLPETMGGGAAVFDADNDGDLDILFINSRKWPWDKTTNGSPATLALYLNEGNWKFKEATNESGLEISCYGQGVACGDFNNDGWVDLYVSCVGKNILLKNNRGRFEDVTQKSGTAGDESQWGTSCGFFDADNDGDLDLFVCNYVQWSRATDLKQNSTFAGLERAYDRPDYFPGTYPYFFRNNGDGTFTEQAKAAGFHVDNPDTKTPMAKSLGVAFEDFNNDGHMDVFVANDTVRNFLFFGTGDGQFREDGIEAGIAFDERGNARGAMGVDAARFRNDTRYGVAIGNFANEMTALYVIDRQRKRGETPRFSDHAVTNGLGPQTRIWLTFAVLWFDYDLDGRLDLACANGHLEKEIARVLSTQTYAQPPQLFWNAGAKTDSEFEPVGPDKCGKDFLQPMVGRGAAYADFDGDGDLDLLLTSVGGPPRLLRNDLDTELLNRNWLRFQLVGDPKQKINRDAIGARIEIQFANHKQFRTVSPTRGYLSQSERTCTFGIPEGKSIRKVLIRWPGGKEQEIPVPKLNRVVVVRP